MLHKQKADLRDAVRLILARMDRSEIILQSQVMSSILYASPLWQSSRSILLFAPIMSEPDLIPGDFHEKEIYCLKSFNSQYEPVRLSSREELKLGPRGIREPVGEVPFPLEKIDLIVVPGLAFDRKGVRLGRGGGHYDRILERYDFGGKVIGACFSCQIVPEVPRGPHDFLVSALLTENSITTAVDNF